MNPRWLGDSFDIVKRFFCERLSALGYEIYAEPMFTDDWTKIEDDYFLFLGAKHASERLQETNRSVLFVDPDTGISEKNSQKHISPERIVQHLNKHELVFVFDQSFARNKGEKEQMLSKLSQIRAVGAHGFYYDSHAKFLFVSRSMMNLEEIREHFHTLGLPRCRLRFLEGSD